MLSRSRALLVSVIAGLAAGLAYPWVDLAISCRVPASEACVWGKAYFSLTVGVSLVLVGGATAGVVYAALAYWRKRRGRDGG